VPSNGKGYWVIDVQGRVNAYGGAPHLGQIPACPKTPANNACLTAPKAPVEVRLGIDVVEPMATIASDPAGSGYWLIGVRGGVYSFGSARTFRSLGSISIDSASGFIQGAAPLPDGGGYWLAAADGGVFATGRAPVLGDARGRLQRGEVVRGIAANLDGTGFVLVTTNGRLLGFGNSTRRLLNQMVRDDPKIGPCLSPSGAVISGCAQISVNKAIGEFIVGISPV
jgi:hypothetical protein